MNTSKPWYKEWANWAHDPDILLLSLAERGAWKHLYALAHECAQGGRLVSPNGKPLQRQSILDAMHLKHIQDVRAYDSMLEKRIKDGALQWDGPVLVVVTYQRDQELIPSETKAAVAERARRYRERKRNPTVTENPLPTVVVSPTVDNKGIYKDNDNDRASRRDGVTVSQENNNTQSQNLADRHETGVTVSREFRASFARSVTENPLLAEASKLYEENIGRITSAVADELRDFASNFKGKVEWLPLAFREAVKNNSMRWVYIRKVLENWEEHGEVTHKSASRKGTKGEAPQWVLHGLEQGGDNADT